MYLIFISCLNGAIYFKKKFVNFCFLDFTVSPYVYSFDSLVYLL